MTDKRAAITEALEDRVAAAERSATMLGEWAAYDLAYAAYAAWVMGDNPLDAARQYLTQLPNGLPGADAVRLRELAASIEQAVTEALE